MNNHLKALVFPSDFKSGQEEEKQWSGVQIQGFPHRLHVGTIWRGFKEDSGACAVHPGAVVLEMAGGAESLKNSPQVISTWGLYLVQVTDIEKSSF